MMKKLPESGLEWWPKEFPGGTGGTGDFSGGLGDFSFSISGDNDFSSLNGLTSSSSSSSELEIFSISVKLNYFLRNWIIK